MESNVKHFQACQEQAYDACMAAMNGRHMNLVALIDANEAYDRTVATLVDLLGEDAPVGQVDLALAGLFSDLWKDEYGCRPSGNATRREAQEFCDRFVVKAE